MGHPDVRPRSSPDEPGSTRAELDAAWRGIEQWYQQRNVSHLLLPGASEADLAKAENQLGVEFPEALRESLRRHNGSRPDAWSTGTLLSCSSIIAATELWRRTADHGEGVPKDFRSSDCEEGVLRPGWWHHAWVAIDEDGFGNGTAVDTDPGAQGEVGQVIDMDGRRGPAWRNADLVEYLVDMLDALETMRVVDGEYLEDDDSWAGIDGDDDEYFEMVDLFVERGGDDARSNGDRP